MTQAELPAPTHRQAAQAALLIEIARGIVAELEPDRLLEQAATLMQANLGYHHVSFFVLEPAEGELVLKARVSLLAPAYAPMARLKIDEGMVGWVARHGEPLLANDVTREPRFYNPCDLPTQAELAVPLRYGGRILGVLDVQSPQLDAFDDHDVATLQALAGLVAIAIHNARLFAETARLKAFHESIVRNTNEGIVLVDREGRITFANPAAAAMLGYEPETLLDQHWSLIVVPAYMARVEAADARRARGEVDRYEIELLRSDGARVPVLVSGAPWYDPARAAAGADPARAAAGADSARAAAGDDFDGSLAVFTDISEQRRLEARIFQAQKMEALGQMARGVAHDFNNLLAVIRVSARMLRASPTTDDAAIVQLNRIEDADLRATDLTRQLLAFSRLDPVQPRPLNMSESVAEMAAMFHGVLGAGIELAMLCSADLWTVEIDRSQVDQVLMNLVVNARDAMPEGGRLLIETTNHVLTAPDIRLLESAGRDGTTSTGLEPGEYVRLTVSDTGVGMAPHVAARIFEPFFTTKEPGKGTGLGLATVFGIVHQNRGGIRIETQPGLGTAVSVYLPRSNGTT